MERLELSNEISLTVTYLLTFELDRHKKLVSEGVKFEDVEYDKIEGKPDKVLASGFITQESNQKTYEDVAAALGELGGIKSKLAEIADFDGTMSDLIAFREGVTDSEKEKYHAAMVILFGISKELAEKADTLTMIISLSRFLVLHGKIQ